MVRNEWPLVPVQNMQKVINTSKLGQHIAAIKPFDKGRASRETLKVMDTLGVAVKVFESWPY